MSSRTGPGPPGRGDVEGLVDVLGDLARVGDLEGVLDEGQRRAEDVGLLEAVGADQLGAHLAGDEDGRDRVQHRVGDRRDQVGRAGAGGGEGDPDPARGLGVALGGVAAALLVADLDVAEVGVDERVVGRQVGPAGDPEDVLDALGLERFHQCVCGSHRTGDAYQRASAASSGPTPGQQAIWPGSSGSLGIDRGLDRAALVALDRVPSIDSTSSSPSRVGSRPRSSSFVWIAL